MDLWQLRTFVTVAKTLNFTKASEELNLSQPAVSHQIRALEEEVGERIFDRERGRVELTESGAILLEYADRIIKTADELKIRFEENRENLTGSFKIGIAGRSFYNPFVSIREAFNEAHPDISMKFRNSISAFELHRDLESSVIDACFTERSPDREKFDFVPYGVFKMNVVAGANHPLVGKQEVAASTLEKERWALLENDDLYRKAVDEVFEKVRIDPRSKFETNDGGVIKDLVETGRYVSMLIKAGIADSLERGKIVVLPCPEMETEVQHYIAWRKNNKSHAVDAFVQFFLDYIVPGMTRSDLDAERNESIKIGA